MVGVPRELQVEFPRRCRVQLGAVLEEDREQVVGTVSQDVRFGGVPAPAEPCAGRVVDPREPHHVVDRDGFIPQDREAGSNGERDRTVDPRVIFVVPENRVFSPRRRDPPEDLRQFLDAVELAVHEVPGGDEQVGALARDDRRHLPGFSVPVDEAEVEVGDLGDPQGGEGRRSLSVTTRTRTTSMRDASTIAYADRAADNPTIQKNAARPEKRAAAFAASPPRPIARRGSRRRSAERFRQVRKKRKPIQR